MRSSSAHVFVDDLDAPVLVPADLHHLGRALRLRAGELVSVSDGHGGLRPCAWTGAGVEPTGEVVRRPAPAPALTVAFAPVKGDRPEWVVQKLTEVGVDRIVPFTAARSVVRWDGERGPRQAERWRRIAREAAMQARRVWLPEVAEPTSFAAVVALPGVALAEPGGDPLTLDRPVVAVGPEGGWAPDELAAGLPRVDLGATVLRAETAAMAAGVLLCALRGGLVVPPPGKNCT